jgi:glyoxylase-like metal-dependent hydrolase (beta-lactamase superfamily II)
VAGAANRRCAARLNAKLVSQVQDKDATFWRDAPKRQVFLGDDAFVEHMQAQAAPARMTHQSMPRVQRLRPLSWPICPAHGRGDRARALHMAPREGGATMPALAQLIRTLYSQDAT